MLLLFFSIFNYKERITIYKILSFDQASVRTGVAVFEDGDLIKYDLIDLHTITPIKRFDLMCARINETIVNEKPDMVVFEDVSLQTNVTTLILLAQIQGAIMQSCISNNIPYTIYKPTTWRKILKFKQGKTIKRAALKAQSVVYASNNFFVENASDDIADAICIGAAFLSLKLLRGDLVEN